MCWPYLPSNQLERRLKLRILKSRRRDASCDATSGYGLIQFACNNFRVLLRQVKVGIKLTFGLELCFLLRTVSAAVFSSLLTVELDPEDSPADTVDAELAEVDCGVEDAC